MILMMKKKRIRKWNGYSTSTWYIHYLCGFIAISIQITMKRIHVQHLTNDNRDMTYMSLHSNWIIIAKSYDEEKKRETHSFHKADASSMVNYFIIGDIGNDIRFQVQAKKSENAFGIFTARFNNGWNRQ